jgi:hypothetical protein
VALRTLNGDPITREEFEALTFEEQLSLMGFGLKPERKGHRVSPQPQDEWEEANEFALLKQALYKKGFESYTTGEWIKHFPISGRVVTVSYNGSDSLSVNFNEEQILYIAPRTLIKVFLGV